MREKWLDKVTGHWSDARQEVQDQGLRLRCKVERPERRDRGELSIASLKV